VLVAHVQFIAWGNKRHLDANRKLTPEQQTRELVSSFPSILGTLQHLYQGNVSWFTRMRGEAAIPWADIAVPKSFPELDAQWRRSFSARWSSGPSLGLPISGILWWL
jgi:uncharacterized damage-inducible protein DinB